MKITIEDAENGFILIEQHYLNKTYIFETMDELIEYIKDIYDYRN